MAKNLIDEFHDDILINEMICYAQSDPEDAAKLLMVAAAYLRKSEDVPSRLACFIADAIEAAMLKPAEYRLKALGRELHLTAGNRRPVKLHPHTLPELIVYCGGKTDAATISQTASAYGISKSTARRLLVTAKAKHDEWASYAATQERGGHRSYSYFRRKVKGFK